MQALSCRHMCLYFSWRYEHSLSSRVLREARPDSSNLRSEDKQPSSTHHKLQYYPIMMR